MLEVRNLDVHYRGIQALRGVDLTVNKGEIFALIGPNGAGKSSLVNALSGWWHRAATSCSRVSRWVAARHTCVRAPASSRCPRAGA